MFICCSFGNLSLLYNGASHTWEPQTDLSSAYIEVCMSSGSLRFYLMVAQTPKLSHRHYDDCQDIWPTASKHKVFLRFGHCDLDSAHVYSPKLQLDLVVTLHSTNLKSWVYAFVFPFSFIQRMLKAIVVSFNIHRNLLCAFPGLGLMFHELTNGLCNWLMHLTWGCTWVVTV